MIVLVEGGGGRKIAVESVNRASLNFEAIGPYIFSKGHSLAVFEFCYTDKLAR